jgi:2-dehydro-3-deoxygluconokinase
MKTKICSVGECMIEIANTKNNIFQQSFAGDTLNFCNYIDKKYFDVSFLTAIGKTSINRSVLEFINSKKISTKLIKQVNSHEIGLYLIKNRNNGEKDGAVWFKTSNLNKEEDKVLVKSSGEPT